MKKFLVFSIILLGCSSLRVISQDLIPYFKYISYYDPAWDAGKSYSTNYAPYGEVFTPYGTVRILIIFARFTNDADQDLGTWPAYLTVPNFVYPVSTIAPSLIFRNTSEFDLYSGTNNRSISKFYYDMSFGQFQFMGDILHDDQYFPICIEIDPTSSNPDFPYTATGWSDLNLRVMYKMRQDIPLFDWSRFDLHQNWPDFQLDASATSPDNKPDYVVIAYRYSPYWSTQPVPGMNGWHGSGGGFSYLSGLSGFNYNGYTFDGAGYTACTGGYSAESYVNLFLHEISHELYACPHLMGGNSAMGLHWQFSTSGWGMMKSVHSVANSSINAWERWLLGWINLTTGDTHENSDIRSDADLNLNGIYTIRDFITTGDAVRIKIPNVANTYLWIENHQRLSPFDHKAWAGLQPSIDGEEIPEMETGLYMYIENVLDDRSLITAGMVSTMSKVNGIKLLNAQGNFDYWHSATAPPPTWDYWWNNILFTFKRLDSNPISGLNPYFMIPDDYPTNPQIPGNDGVIDYAPNYNGGDYEAYDIVRETNDTYTGMTYAHLGGVNDEARVMLGRRSDTFQEGDEVSLSGIVPALNYPYYNQTDSKIENYILNGLNVKVLSYNSTTKTYQIQIKFDDFTICNDKRWCGNIELVNNNSVAAPDLILDNNVTLEFDLNGNANRHTVHPHFGNFKNPSIFKQTNNSYLKLNPSSEMLLKNYSASIIDNNCKIDIQDDAILRVKQGSSLVLKNQSTLNIFGSGRIEIEPGAYICIEPDAIINLQNELSVINLRPGYHSGVNTNVLTGFTNCYNPASMYFTGNGSVNSDFTSNKYIQNETINVDRYVTGHNISVGYNVTTQVPQGLVTIINGIEVILDASGDILLDKGFEIQSGAAFEVRK